MVKKTDTEGTIKVQADGTLTSSGTVVVNSEASTLESEIGTMVINSDSDSEDGTMKRQLIFLCLRNCIICNNQLLLILIFICKAIKAYSLIENG